MTGGKEAHQSEGKEADCLYTSDELGVEEHQEVDASDSVPFNSPTEEFTPFMTESCYIPSVPDKVGRHLIGIQLLESEQC
jgi:hypothetical protein